jgi:hypothetical protein
MKTRWNEHEEPSSKDIRDEILRFLLMMKPGESICPSDIGRTFGSKWRELMTTVRDVASDMVRDGAIEITQNGEVVDIDERKIETLKGPIRLRLAKRRSIDSSSLDDSEDD